MKIGYYPDLKGSNAYTSRFREILSRFGEVRGFSFKNEIKLLSRLRFSRLDYLFINWLDSELIDEEGKFRLSGFLKIYLKILFFKFRAKKLIYVKHNHFPHGTAENAIGKIQRIMSWLSKRCHQTIVHSPVAANSDCIYIPHPLYSSNLDAEEVEVSQENSFICFGRIVAYKQFETLFPDFPSEKSLIIAGSCEDKPYLELLNREKPGNVKVIAEFISDEDAAALIQSTQGLVLTHSDPDMIVSGSFFYALSLGVRVYCCYTPFLEWASKTFGEDVVVCCKDISQLNQALAAALPRKPFSAETKQAIRAAFSDEAIALTLQNTVFN